MNKGFVELSLPMGGVLWKGDLVGRDAGYSTVKSFIEQHKHDGWTLSVFDELTKATKSVAKQYDRGVGYATNQAGKTTSWRLH